MLILTRFHFIMRYYQQVADLVIDTGKLNLAEIVREIRIAKS